MSSDVAPVRPPRSRAGRRRASRPRADGCHRPADAAPGRARASPGACVVPVVTAAAGLMFAMSFQAAQGRDLRADRDLPQLIIEGDAQVAAKAAQLDAPPEGGRRALQDERPHRRAARQPDPAGRRARRDGRDDSGPRHRASR